MLQICLLRNFLNNLTRKFIEKRKKERGWMKSFYFKYLIKIFSYLEMDYINIEYNKD